MTVSKKCYLPATPVCKSKANILKRGWKIQYTLKIKCAEAFDIAKVKIFERNDDCEKLYFS